MDDAKRARLNAEARIQEERIVAVANAMLMQDGPSARVEEIISATRQLQRIRLERDALEMEKR